MSGGSYNYAFGKIQDLACEIRENSSLLRKVFKEHLEKVARACHDIEWVDSGDYGEGDEDEAICACLGESAPVRILDMAIRDAVRAQKILEDAIERAEEAKNG